jgi:hypothetical protein
MRQRSHLSRAPADALGSVLASLDHSLTRREHDTLLMTRIQYRPEISFFIAKQNARESDHISPFLPDLLSTATWCHIRFDDKISKARLFG